MIFYDFILLLAIRNGLLAIFFFARNSTFLNAIPFFSYDVSAHENITIVSLYIFSHVLNIFFKTMCII